MPSSQVDSSTVAIPWFNNIWLNDTPRSRSAAASGAAAPPGAPTASCRHSQSRQSLHSSSHQTISTMSAVDRVSLCSLPSTATARCSAQDIGSMLQTLSESNSSDFLAAPIPHPPGAVSLADPDTKVSLQMRLLQLRSAELRSAELRSARMKHRAVKVSSAANIPSSQSATQSMSAKTKEALLRTR